MDGFVTRGWGGSQVSLAGRKLPEDYQLDVAKPSNAGGCWAVMRTPRTHQRPVLCARLKRGYVENGPDSGFLTCHMHKKFEQDAQAFKALLMKEESDEQE